MVKNKAGQVIHFNLRNVSDGTAYTGAASTVTVYLTLDGGTQATGGGVIENEGNGQYSYRPSQAETNADSIGVAATASAAIMDPLQIFTVTQAELDRIQQASAGDASTARELIEDALEAEGFLSEGLDMSAWEATRGLRSLNLMLRGWQARQLTVPYRTTESFTLTIGQSDYTIGVGGDLDTARPLAIHNAYLRESNTDYQLAEAALQIWAQRSRKSERGRPAWYYYEPEEPLGRLRFTREPDAAYTLVLHSLKPLTTFASLDSTDAVPDEWQEAIKYNLAMRFAAAKGKQVSQLTAAMASKNLQAIENLTARHRIPRLTVEDALRQGHGAGFDIDDIEG